MTSQYASFYIALIPLFPRVFRLVRLHDELCLLVLKLLHNFTRVVSLWETIKPS